MQQRKQLQGGKTNGTSGSHAETKKYPSVSDDSGRRRKSKSYDRGSNPCTDLEKCSGDPLLCGGFRRKKQAVLDALAEGNRKKTQNAPVFLISAVILNRAGFQKDGTADNELGNGWGYYDCGLHDMNLLLEAADQGLSTLVMGLRDADKLREAFDIPKEESIVSVISVGYSDADPDRPTRKSVEEIAKFF